VEVEQLARHASERREVRRITLGSHTGTHVDAPRHFLEGAGSVDDIPMDALVGPARIARLTGRDGQALGRADIEAALGGPPPDRLILHVGGDAYAGAPAYYERHAYITPAAAEWLVSSGVRLLAIDAPQPDAPAGAPSSEEEAPVHKILLRAGVALVEGVCGLSDVPVNDVELIVAPLKLTGADGAPARVLAVVYEV
jgi:kynurenine formamidase